MDSTRVTCTNGLTIRVLSAPDVMQAPYEVHGIVDGDKDETFRYFLVDGDQVRPYRSKVHESVWTIYQSPRHVQDLDFRTLATPSYVVVEANYWKSRHLKDGLGMRINIDRIFPLTLTPGLAEHYEIEGTGQIRIGVQKMYRYADPFNFYWRTGSWAEGCVSDKLVTFTYFVVTKRAGEAGYVVQGYEDRSERVVWFTTT